MKRLFASAAVIAAAIAAPASAAVFDFSYTGVGIAASGQFTTTDTPDSNGFLTVTGLTGSRNGTALTLLAPGSYPSISPNDNLLSPTAPFLTFAGISFTGGGINYNVYYSTANALYRECSSPGLECDVEVVLTGFSVTRSTGGAVPEPATWAMMIGGFGLVGAAMRRRAGKAVAAA